MSETLTGCPIFFLDSSRPDQIHFQSTVREGVFYFQEWRLFHRVETWRHHQESQRKSKW